ncbi:bifunctional protein-disulfide isomerase/oxidoreductase DsbC [Thalassotalea ganghwensis]
MLKTFITGVTLSLSLLISTSAFVAHANQGSNATTQSAEVSAQLAQLKTKLAPLVGEVSSLELSPMVGLVEVISENRVFYSSLDGNFLIEGTLYDLNARANLTEKTKSDIRVAGIESFKDDMIVFKAKDEKHVVTVFTDITCGYCRKLHEQMADYNDRGITIQYLAYPRYGIKDQTGEYSKGFKDLRSIWCHEDPQEALTKAKLGSSVAQRICESPVEQEFNFGRQIGVSGTPAMIFENGFMLPGYKDPESLLKIIESVNAAG